MELTKKILNISIAVSMILLSLSIFIHTIRGDKAMAYPKEYLNDDFTPLAVEISTREPLVVGYKKTTGGYEYKYMGKIVGKTY